MNKILDYDVARSVITKQKQVAQLSQRDRATP